MEAPIHTFFKYLKDDETKYISHDSITRYYEMLRFLMKTNKLFGGKQPIENLYKYRTEYREIFLKSKYTLYDTLLFETKLEVIKNTFLSYPPKIQSETKVAIDTITGLFKKNETSKVKPHAIIVPTFILSTLGFLFLNQRVK